jgi:hypothetical protein
LSACSTNSSASPKVGSAVSNTTTTLVGVVSDSTVVSGPATATPTATTIAATAPTAAAAVDGATLLQQAVAASAAGYHFNETATVDGAVAVTIDGDRLPSGARLAVSNSAGLVYYVITPDGTWLMPQNGEWEVDDSPAPDIDPIGALNTPTSVTVASSDGTTVQLAVTVPMASLGIAGDGDAALQVSIVSGLLSSITYKTTTSDGKPADTTTLFTPAVDTSPVVAPI